MQNNRHASNAFFFNKEANTHTPCSTKTDDSSKSKMMIIIRRKKRLHFYMDREMLKTD